MPNARNCRRSSQRNPASVSVTMTCSGHYSTLPSSNSTTDMQLFPLIVMLLPLIAQTPRHITYEDDVKPILQRHCFTCHSAAQMTAGLSLESYPGVLKGGGSGKIVKPGRSAASLLYQVIAQETDGVPRMPFGQPKIPENEIAIIRDWIDLGLLADATSSPKGQIAQPLDFK